MLTLISFIFVLGLLIFVHELGHFLVAKWAGVRVEVFSLGFGPSLFSVTRGDTEYCICAIPLGGYVKMTGQEDMPGESDSKLTGADYEFPSKPWWQRLLIAVAGPMMNFVAAFFLFYGVYFFIGIPEPILPNDTTVEEVSKDYPAQGVLQPGDRILAVDGKPVSLWRELVREIQQGTSEKVSLDVQRGSEKMSLSLAIKVEQDGMRRVGIVTAEPAVLGEIHRDVQLPPETAHLRPGDTIVAINHVPINSWSKFEKAIQDSPKTPMQLEISRKAPFEVEVLTSPEQGEKLAGYGVTMQGERVTAVAAGSRAEDAGVRPGDVVLSEKIRPLPFFKKLFRNIRGDNVQETLVVGLRREQPFELKVTPIENPLNHQGLLGVEKKVEVAYHRFLPLESLQAASFKFVDSSMLVFVILKRLVTAELPASTLAGPVGIMQVTGKQAEKGLMDLLLLAAMLSVNLAIVNLLPIPILDGSHILLCLVEGVRRKPVNAKVQNVLQYIGLIILLPFILYVTFHDIIRWIRDIIG